MESFFVATVGIDGINELRPASNVVSYEQKNAPLTEKKKIICYFGSGKR